MKNYLLCAALAFAALVPCVQAQTVTRGAYLQNGSTTAVTVRWRTGTAADSAVRYGTTAGSLTQTVSVTGTRTEHEVRLTGLSPDTTYYYSIGTTTATLAGDSTYFFVTAPTSAKPTRVWVLGDSGIGGTVQTNVRNAYYTFTGTRHTDLWMMLGDNAYNSGTDAEYTSYLFNYYPTMLRKSVLWPTLGNHDAGSADSPTQSGPYYAQHTLPKAGEAGGVASGTEAYYSYDYGNIHFVCLDSADTSVAANGAMANWVTSDLQNNTKDWTVVFFHHPPYSKGSHDSDSESLLVSMRTNFNPIFENYGADLVLCGHSHSYERSRLLDGHYGLSSTFNSTTMVKQAGSGAGAGAYTKTAVGPVAHQGTIYAVPGASGQTSGGTLNHPAMWISLNVAGSMVLDFNNNRLDAIYLDSTGAQRDTFTMIKGGTGNALPSVSITAPANGASFVAPASITIDATASDSDGTVSSVAFYQGTTLLGTDTTSPYSFAWTNVAAGSYSLTAVATDNAGATKTSTAVAITVNNPGNVAPTASITSPTAGATFSAPASITINANAADTDGTVSSVAFYQGTTLLGTDTTSPYSFAWTNVAAGTYSLTARATDNGGATGTSSAVSVTVNASGTPTTVSLQNGVNGYNGMVDADIRFDAKTTNTGNNTTVLIDGSPDYSALMKWDLTSIPAGKTVTNVTLTFNVTDISANVYELYALRRAWTETAATWNQATSTVNWGTAGASNTTSDRETAILGTLSASATGSKTITLTAAGIAKVQAWINTPSSNNGFIIQDYANSDGIDLSSSEATTVTQRPIITITYQ